MDSFHFSHTSLASGFSNVAFSCSITVRYENITVEVSKFQVSDELEVLLQIVTILIKIETNRKDSSY